ncbi:MAG: peroxidase-related enzyme [Euryarchaeota archaeon]|nr:peroxidase-related enzyme [Euryarchaeota archaeon]
MPHVKIIDEADATGRLKEIYDDTRRKRGSIANILKSQSLLPETLAAHLDFYLAIQFGKNSENGLTRAQREMLAVVVSAANRCDYCVAHHADALDRYWREEPRTKALAEDFRNARLSPAETALAGFAERLTKSPGAVGAGDVEELKKVGWKDEAILQTILTTGYFNFVNRLAIGAGVAVDDVEKPYDY